MRITNRLMVNSFGSNLMRTQSNLYKINNQVATGRRINRPSDDPVGTARSMLMNTSITEIAQYNTNSKTATTWMDSTDNALFTVNKELQRVYQLLLKGASDSNTPDSREALAAEIDEIKSGIMEIANTNIDNRYIFGGTTDLNQTYVLRATVNGDTRNLEQDPIVIDSSNNRIKIKLDNEPTQTLILTSKKYDGSQGHTLDDLVKDIQTQLEPCTFGAPVYVKVNNDNQIEFYAGTQPSDGKTHTIVLKEGPAIKSSGTAQFISDPPPFNQIGLAYNSNVQQDFYSGWNVTITGGKGLGQTRTISTYNGSALVPTYVASLTSDWSYGLEPDQTSTYTLLPPLDGTTTLSPPAGNIIDLDTNSHSRLDDFYNGMNITFTDTNGNKITRKINDYSGTGPTEGQATLDGPALPVGTYTYTITPHLEGRTTVPGAAGDNKIQLNTDFNIIPNFYTGASITVTHSNGAVETQKIIGYTGAGLVTVENPWKLPIADGDSYEISDTALEQLGFQSKATTKELVGDKILEPVMVMGKYPLSGTVNNAVLPASTSSIKLDIDASITNDFYKNWTIKITSGTGVGQTARVESYNPVTKVATLNTSFSIDKDSVYSLEPPAIGGSTSGVAQGGNLTTMTLSNTASSVDNYYNGWTVSIISGTGAGQTVEITDYDGKSNTITVPNFNIQPDSTSHYVLNPPNTANLTISGTGAVFATGPDQVTLPGGVPNNTYNNWTVIDPATGVSGVITNYTASVATIGGGWVPAVPVPTGPNYILVPPVSTDNVQGATVNTISLDPASSSINDNCYNGWTITIVGGTGAGQQRTLSGYNGTNQVAGVTSNWTTVPDATSQYLLTPPTLGRDQIRLTNGSMAKDFYVGMPITITNGSGKGQTRYIKAYNEESQIATVDSDWGTLPDATSTYSIDTHYNNNALNKFKITVGSNTIQEIDLDGGTYSAAEFAKAIQSKINVRGGAYANVKVYLTNDKQLRMRYEDPTLKDNDAPLNIKLESGTTADILGTMGFSNGIFSEKPEANYEGDKGIIRYEVNIGITMQVNEIGQEIFDPIFKHIDKIALDLRAGKISELGGTDITNIQADIERVLVTQGSIGAKVNRMEKASDRLDVLDQNMKNLLAHIEDVDMAQVIMDLELQQTAYQAALQVGARILPASLLDYMK